MDRQTKFVHACRFQKDLHECSASSTAVFRMKETAPLQSRLLTRYNNTALFLEVFPSWASKRDRHAGAGGNSARDSVPCAMLWPPAFAGVTEPLFFSSNVSRHSPA
jgi:hypothetical protein